jgi:hypothetical protein
LGKGEEEISILELGTEVAGSISATRTVNFNKINQRTIKVNYT